MAGAVSYTPAQKEWMAQHPVIRVGGERDWAPIDFVNHNGVYDGLARRILDTIAKESGLHFVYETDQWDVLLQKTKQREIDLLPAINYSEERSQELIFSTSYYNLYSYIFAHIDAKVHNIEDLKTKRVAIPNSFQIEQEVRRRFPNMTIVKVATLDAAIEAVLQQRADLLIDTYAVLYYKLREKGIQTIRPFQSFESMPLYMAASKNNAMLIDIINTTLESISQTQKETMLSQWVSVAAENRTNFKLNTQEQAWINKHPQITFGADRAWPPFEFVDQQGRYQGIAADFIQLISQRTGLQIQIKPDIWSQTLQQMREGKIDGLSCAVQTPKRSEFLNFTTPYVSVESGIVVRNENTKVHELKDLYGLRVAINKDSYMHEWLAQKYPKIKILGMRSNQESIEAVAYGKADAYIGNLAVFSYVVETQMISNLKVVNKLDEQITRPAFAVGKESPELFSILQKALDSITFEERQKILKKWYAPSGYTNAPSLSDVESQWLQKHPVITFSGDPDWLPFEAFTPDGTYTGIVAQYLDEIEAMLKISFKRMAPANWKETLKRSQEGDIDVISGNFNDAILREHYVPVTPYIKTPIVIVMRGDQEFVSDLDAIAQKRIGVIDGYSYADQMINDYPLYHFERFSNADKLIKALSDKKIDAALMSMPKAGYIIRTQGYANLKIVGKTDMQMQLTLFVHRSKPILHDIIEKTLRHIPEAKHTEIIREWMDVKFAKKTDYMLLAQIVGVLLLFIAGTLYWNRKLSKEVARRKKLELELIEATKVAMAANRSKSEFLANMSHEIRTPMNAIIGFTDLLYEQLKEPRLLTYVKTIQSAGKTLLGLINDILDLSKIEAGKMTLLNKPTNLADLFEEIGSIFSMTLRNKNLALVIDIDEQLPKSLLIDSTRVRQILFNLLGNAVKFTDTGHITLALRTLEVHDHHSKVDLEITVEDSGVGIAADQIEKIFNLFEQQEGQDNRKYGGTGLGLAITKRLVEMMGGAIHVQSTLGQGSRFIVSFFNIDIASVMASQQMPSAKSFDDTQIIFEASRVLVVDDIRDNRDLVMEYFKETPIKMLGATNGAEAVEMIKEQHFDLIIMDIRMPVMDGYEASRRIKAEHDIPIIALTASVMQGERDRVEDAHFDGYLRKPVLRHDLFLEASRFLKHELCLVQKNSSEPKVALREATLKQLPEILERMSNTMAQLHQKARASNNISDIRMFATALKTLAQEYEVEMLMAYGLELDAALDSFDIGLLQQLLNRYESLQRTLALAQSQH